MVLVVNIGFAFPPHWRLEAYLRWFCFVFLLTERFTTTLFQPRCLHSARHERKISHEFDRTAAGYPYRWPGGDQHALFDDQTLRWLPISHQWHLIVAHKLNSWINRVELNVRRREFHDPKWMGLIQRFSQERRKSFMADAIRILIVIYYRCLREIQWLSISRESVHVDKYHFCPAFNCPTAEYFLKERRLSKWEGAVSFSFFTLPEVTKASEISAIECRIRGRRNVLAKTNLGIDQSSKFRSLGIKASICLQKWTQLGLSKLVLFITWSDVMISF